MWYEEKEECSTPRVYPATKTPLQTPTLRVCVWTTHYGLTRYVGWMGFWHPDQDLMKTCWASVGAATGLADRPDPDV